MMFKTSPSTVIAIAVLLSMPTSGYGGVIQSNGFVGYYSLESKDGNPYGNWESQGNGDYDVEVFDSGSKLRLSVGASSAFSSLAFSILIPADGYIWFSWSTENAPEGSFTYSLGNVDQGVVPDGLETSVEANQILTLYLDSFDQDQGDIIVEINDFSGPYVIPEPSTFGLMTLAFAGLGLRLLWRRRKRGHRF
jgi:hypothetical protein